MPKPIFGDNGSGMHTHISLWKTKSRCLPVVATPDSATWRCTPSGDPPPRPGAVGLHQPHHQQLQALVPGYEAPVNLAYSQRNRSAACRIPMYSPSPKSKRIEFRCPDASSNPYLAFSALLMAVIDGIQNKIHPG